MATTGSHTLTFASLATNILSPSATFNVIESSTFVYDFTSATINKFYVKQPTPGYIFYRDEPTVKSNKGYLSFRIKFKTVVSATHFLSIKDENDIFSWSSTTGRV
jgi:hypothetical protein